jgi:iron(III) transport system ATP-binding protein
MARPESLRVVGWGVAVATVLVTARVFLGASVEMYVKTDAGEILVQLDDPSGKTIPSEGETVWIGFDEKLVRVLPAE